MPATSDQIVQDLRAEFETLLESVVSAEARSMTADTMERRLLRQVLALGRSLFALFLATRAAATEQPVDRSPDGVERPYNSLRERTVLSIFGPVVFTRPYFYRADVGGAAPVDAHLSLPPTRCSDLVRETVEELGVEDAYHKGLGVLRRLLGLALSTRTLKEQVAEDAPEVAAFEAQQAPPPSAEEAAILVVQADGKGVPILRPPATSAPVRLGKGQKRGGKKEATLTAVYTLAPAVRTPEAVVASLFAPASTPPAVTPERAGPRHKQLRATLAGKDAALAEAANQVTRRDGPHLAHRVALTDGAPALQERVRQWFPSFTLVLDLIHATEYLWDAANALWGEAHPARLAWVQARTLLLLQSAVLPVADELERLAQDPRRTKRAAKVLRGVAGYLARNLAALAPDGRIANIGLQQGRRAELDFGLLMAKRATIMSTTLRARPPEQKAGIVAAVAASVWPLVDAGALRPVIYRELPLAQAGEAHRIMDASAHTGKLVLRAD